MTRSDGQGLSGKKSSIFEFSTFGLPKEGELVSQDHYAVRVSRDICIAVVCDGVGSASAGGEAARRCVNYLVHSFKAAPEGWSVQKSLGHFISSINEILYKEGMEAYDSPEYLSTLSIAVIEGNRLYGANVGDSPVTLFRDGNSYRLHMPHVVEEKGMEDVLTEVMGLREDVEAYFFESELKRGDILLLCSDGPQKVLEKAEIEALAPLGAAALVKRAYNKARSKLPDDCSAVVVRITGENMKERLKRQNLPLPSSLKRGEIIDGYMLLEPMSPDRRTWSAGRKGVEYVLKFPPAQAAEDERMLDMFVKEAWNASRLKAGFFPKAVIPKNRTYRYYLMQKLEGETLESHIDGRRLPVEESVTLALFLLDACRFLLSRDLVHGDIKAENIIVMNRRGKRVFKLVDYGSIVEIFSTTSRAGTPSYLAPERFRGEAINESSEIFSIGVTLYKALCGRYPYGEIEPFQTPVFKTPKAVRHYNTAVPAWLESVVMRAIEKNPDRRYSLYSEMAYELRNPQKVKPYYPEDISIFEKNPAKIYRILFTLSAILNALLILRLIS